MKKFTTHTAHTTRFIAALVAIAFALALAGCDATRADRESDTPQVIVNAAPATNLPTPSVSAAETSDKDPSQDPQSILSLDALFEAGAYDYVGVGEDDVWVANGFTNKAKQENNILFKMNGYVVSCDLLSANGETFILAAHKQNPGPDDLACVARFSAANSDMQLVRIGDDPTTYEVPLELIAALETVVHHLVSDGEQGACLMEPFCTVHTTTKEVI